MEMRFVNLEREGGDGPFTPFDVGLQWMVDFHHDFSGKKALLARWEAKEGRVPVCWSSNGELETPKRHTPLTIEGCVVGEVTHAAFSPSLERVIGTARVDSAVAASGLKFALGDQGNEVETVSAPFLVATSFHVPLE